MPHIKHILPPSPVAPCEHLLSWRGWRGIFFGFDWCGDESWYDCIEEEEIVEHEGETLCPLYYGDEEREPPLCSMDEQWIKLNYDSGAAVTAFPKSGVPQEISQAESSSNYKTAGGQLVPDLGGVKLTAEDENCQLRKMHGRVSEVHKSLISASKSAEMGQNGWPTKGGGWIVPEKSKASEQIHKILELEAAKPDSKMIPLYEERGVYNFYLKMTPGRGKMEADKPRSFQSLSKEELITEVTKLRGMSAGFQGQSR